LGKEEAAAGGFSSVLRAFQQYNVIQIVREFRDQTCEIPAIAES